MNKIYSKESARNIILNSKFYKRYKDENDLILELLNLNVDNIGKICEVSPSDQSCECCLLFDIKDRKILIKAFKLTSALKLSAYEKKQRPIFDDGYSYNLIESDELIKIIPELIYVINYLC